MIFIELVVAVVILVGSLCLLNDRCLIPGTDRYNRVQEKERKSMEIETARQNLVLSRLRLRETENIDRMLLLPMSDEARAGSDMGGASRNGGKAIVESAESS